MFTGLIQDVGTVAAVALSRGEAELSFQTALEGLALGESVAVMGACLTVTATSPGRFSAFASEETLEKTGLGDVAVGGRVNLERALKLGDPLGGHLVTGHVDTRVELLSRRRVAAAEALTFALPSGGLSAQIAAKGSIAIDGVSLTVNQVTAGAFSVMIIPLTLKETTMGAVRVGAFVNIETDILAKYIARQLGETRETPGVDLALLERAGFVR
jgi:riboflavin synthase